MKEPMEALDRSCPTITKRVGELMRKGILEPLGAKTSPKRRYRLTDAKTHLP